MWRCTYEKELKASWILRPGDFTLSTRDSRKRVCGCGRVALRCLRWEVKYISLLLTLPGLGWVTWSHRSSSNPPTFHLMQKSIQSRYQDITSSIGLAVISSPTAVLLDHCWPAASFWPHAFPLGLVLAGGSAWHALPPSLCMSDFLTSFRSLPKCHFIREIISYRPIQLEPQQISTFSHSYLTLFWDSNKRFETIFLRVEAQKKKKFW